MLPYIYIKKNKKQNNVHHIYGNDSTVVVSRVTQYSSVLITDDEINENTVVVRRSDKTKMFPLENCKHTEAHLCTSS